MTEAERLSGEQSSRSISRHSMESIKKQVDSVLNDVSEKDNDNNDPNNNNDNNNGLSTGDDPPDEPTLVESVKDDNNNEPNNSSAQPNGAITDNANDPKSADSNDKLVESNDANNNDNSNDSNKDKNESADSGGKDASGNGIDTSDPKNNNDKDNNEIKEKDDKLDNNNDNENKKNDKNDKNDNSTSNNDDNINNINNINNNNNDDDNNIDEAARETSPISRLTKARKSGDHTPRETKKTENNETTDEKGKGDNSSSKNTENEENKEEKNENKTDDNGDNNNNNNSSVKPTQNKNGQDLSEEEIVRIRFLENTRTIFYRYTKEGRKMTSYLQLSEIVTLSYLCKGSRQMVYKLFNDKKRLDLSEYYGIIGSPEFDTRSFYKIFLPKWKNVEILILRYCSHLQASHLDRIITHLTPADNESSEKEPANMKIKHLNLYFCSRLGSNTLVKIRNRLRALETLNIGRCYAITANKNYNAFKQLIGSPIKKLTFSLDPSIMKDEAMDVVSDLIHEQSFPNLVEVDLSHGCQILNEVDLSDLQTRVKTLIMPKKSKTLIKRNDDR